jgi:hypothetical protein
MLELVCQQILANSRYVLSLAKLANSCSELLTVPLPVHEHLLYGTVTGNYVKRSSFPQQIMYVAEYGSTVNSQKSAINVLQQ